MAKEKDNEKETKLSRLDAKREQAEAKKEEIVKQIEEIKSKISEETDEKEKAKLRKQRDELIEQKEAFVITDEKVKIPLAKGTKTAIKSCIAIVLVVALLVTYVATGWAKHGFISTLGWPQKAFTGLVLTDADGEKHGIKVSTYNYYFANFYNQQQQQQQYMSQLGGLGGESGSSDVDFEKAFKEQTYTDPDSKEKMTWSQHAENEVIDNIKSVYTYYYAAVKKNNGKEPEIKDDQKKELKDTLKEYKDEAKKYGYTLSAYLEAALGHGVDEATFRHEATVSYISQNYKDDYQDELAAKAYKDADYQKYLKEHKDELVSVDVKYFECSNEDEAKAMVKALKDDGSNFAALASKYSETAYEKKANKDAVETTYKSATRAMFQGVGAAIGTADEHEHEDGEKEQEEKYSGLDWLYSKDRKAGDKKAYSTSVVYVLKPVYLSDIKTVNVRHILIKLKDESKKEDEEEAGDISAEDATDAQWDAAKKGAEKVLKEFKSNKESEEAFGELAKKYSDDSNASDGGLYENITPNQMVPTFNAWCFDSARKAGDTAIVKTEYGYHVMYFVSAGKIEAWKYTAQQALASEDGEKTVDKFEKSIKIKKSWPGSCYFEVDTDISN
ncbi:MAG: peptidylprolyl isomerase [Eubacterium sp.]|nr:peptidylprolyl isomerase [Eubacterium sp.]